MDTGHLLVGKQRDEPRLIEFGPAGSEPQGYSPGDALAASSHSPSAATAISGHPQRVFEAKAGAA